MNQEIFEKLPSVLLPWYRSNKRALPWRIDKDPYHVWLSEIMLQQTRVEAVKGYYDRFLTALPTIASLANAEDELLHKLWEGLGYYSRVRNLKKAAEVIVREYDGQFPNDHDQVLALPGIGPYTAGAICSISFDMPTPAVDGNVLRLASRLTNDDTPIDLPAYRNDVSRRLAQVYPKDAGDFTQALMELGATLCGPNRKPECSLCPCSGFCTGYNRGTAESLPVKSPKKQRRTEKKTVFVLSCDGQFALQKRPQQGLLAGLWQFPNMDGKLSLEDALKTIDAFGLKVRDVVRTVERKHIFTHVQWNMIGFYLEVSEPVGEFVWMDRQKINTAVALPTAFRQFWDTGEDVVNGQEMVEECGSI